MPIQLNEESGGKVLAIRVSGKVAKADYEHFVPEFDRLVKQQGKQRVLFDMTGFHGWKANALWEDIKFEIKHFADIERLAIVGEKKWQHGMATFCKPFTKATVRYFDHTKAGEARKWLRKSTDQFTPSIADGSPRRVIPMRRSISQKTIVALSNLDTCAVTNAIECFDVRLRNEGYTDDSIHCRFPALPPMVGYAMTLRVRSSSVPWTPDGYLARTDWWAQLQKQLVPHVLVIQDMDRPPGTGAFVGEVHAAILQALGCVGAITNGAVRDLPAVGRLGFQLFSSGISVSHAYMHIVEVGGPVEIGGLRIAPGDLLHGDRHGIVQVPFDVAGRIPETVARILQREQRIVKYCRSEKFSLDGLRRIVS